MPIGVAVSVVDMVGDRGVCGKFTGQEKDKEPEVPQGQKMQGKWRRMRLLGGVMGKRRGGGKGKRDKRSRRK
jgi:hypothetical protein